MKARILFYLMLVLVIPSLSGCWVVAAAGAGAYGGYRAAEEGYELQKPVINTPEPEKEKRR